MRIFASIAISVAILFGAAVDIRAGQSPAASSPEATSGSTGRVTIDNQGAPGVAIALQPATTSQPLPAPVARAATDDDAPPLFSPGAILPLRVGAARVNPKAHWILNGLSRRSPRRTNCFAVHPIAKRSKPELKPKKKS